MVILSNVKEIISTLSDETNIAVVDDSVLVKKLRKLYPIKNIYTVSNDVVTNYITGYVSGKYPILFILQDGETYFYEGRC